MAFLTDSPSITTARGSPPGHQLLGRWASCSAGTAPAARLSSSRSRWDFPVPDRPSSSSAAGGAGSAAALTTCGAVCPPSGLGVGSGSVRSTAGPAPLSRETNLCSAHPTMSASSALYGDTAILNLRFAVSFCCFTAPQNDDDKGAGGWGPHVGRQVDRQPWIACGAT